MSGQNIIYNEYNRAARAGMIRWAVSCAVLGISASFVAEDEERISDGLRIAMIYNLICACAHFPLFGPFPTPISETVLRPRAWYIVILVASTLMWLAACGVTLAFMFSLDLRSELSNRAAACIGLFVMNIVLCGLQWTMIYRVIKCQNPRKFGPRYRGEGYELVMNKFHMDLVPRGVSKYFRVVQEAD